MANILYEELIDKEFVPIFELDEDIPPTYVVLYLKNLSLDTDKKIIVQPVSSLQLQLDNQNPSMRFENGRATFCLTPSINISCEGATDSIYFSNFRGDWDFELDGVWQDDVDKFPPLFIWQNLSNILNSSSDGDWSLSNIDTQSHRIKLIPLNNPSIPNTYSTLGDDPTFIAHEDGSLTFCLAPA